MELGCSVCCQTLEDLGVETSSSDYNIAAPNAERALRNSHSNRLDAAHVL